MGETSKKPLEQVFEESSTAIYRVLYSYCGGRADVAQEAVAEAFARAVPRYDGIRNPVPWLYKTAIGVASRELGRKAETSDEPVSDELSADFHDLIEALRHLSPQQRGCLVLRYELDLPVKEVAWRMGITATTASVHIHRGKKRLAELLSAQEVRHARLDT